MECAIPSPTFENPMPAMYWPSAMPSRPSFLFSTASLKEAEISLIASRWNISVISHAAFVVYPSIACVRASIPVEAVSPFGMEDIISGSITAMIGISCGSTQTNLRLRSTSVIT